MGTLEHPAVAPVAPTHDEYHDQPVPLRARLGFKDPALVWSGFGIAYICAVIGGLIQNGLGTRDALLAIALGNLLLFAYSAPLAYASGRWGMNFPLAVKAVFGPKGAAVPVLVMALLVTGWSAFQAWLTADIVRVALGLEAGPGVGIAGAVIAVLMGLPVIFGIKSMANLMKLALPLMLIFALYYFFSRVVPNFGAVIAKPGNGKIAFLTGVGMAWSTFVVSGTMTGDIVRFCRSGRQAVGVTGVAFLFSNAPFMMLGALIAAVMPENAPAYFIEPGSPVLVVALVVIAIMSNWSTCDACLYNATMGFSNALPGVDWRRAAILGTTIGVIAAGTGIIGNIVNWLILLGLVVPPIGGTVLADYFVVRGDRVGFSTAGTEPFNWAALAATVAGIGVGLYFHVAWPDFLFGVPGIVVSFAVYVALARLTAAASLASARPSGAEAD